MAKKRKAAKRVAKKRVGDAASVKVGNHLASARGLVTQRGFAKKLGISRGYLSDLENGRKSLSLKLFTQFCDKLDVSPNHLLGYKQ